MKSNIIDVSHHNGLINWQQLKAEGVEAAFIKCSNGSHNTDDMYKYNSKEAKKAGILIGAYHFLLSQQNAVDQANNYLANVGTTDLLPVIDIEWDFKNNIDQWKTVHQNIRIEMLGKFIKKMKTTLKVMPIIYTNRFWWHTMFGSNREYEDVIFNFCPLWIADYSTITTTQLKCPLWENITLRQFSERGKINGIQNFVDLNELGNGKTLSNLRMY